VLADQRFVRPAGDSDVRTPNQRRQPASVVYARYDMDDPVGDGDSSNVYGGVLEQIEQGHIVIKRQVSVHDDWATCPGERW
jgi:hypothetical protein